MSIHKLAGKTLGGSQKEPLQEAVEGKFGHVINVGDRIITFTQAGRHTNIDAGTFKGVMRILHRHSDYVHEAYIVERDGGRRTKLHYNGMIPISMKLEDLIGHCV